MDMTTSDSPFRLGLIGAGAVTASLHLPGALASTHVTVAAIADPVVGRAQQLAREYGITPLIAERFEDILPQVDGVVIATPNQTHHKIAIDLLARGRALSGRKTAGNDSR